MFLAFYLVEKLLAFYLCLDVLLMEHIQDSALQYMYFVGDDLVVHIELIVEINKRIEI